MTVSGVWGLLLHKSHPEGPTSSWNFKQCVAYSAAPLLPERLFRSLTYSA